MPSRDFRLRDEYVVASFNIGAISANVATRYNRALLRSKFANSRSDDE